MQSVRPEELTGKELTPALATILAGAHLHRQLVLDYEPVGAIKSDGTPIVDRETGKPFREGLREFKPYSLRRSKAGQLFLMGQNGNDGTRAYRVDCIKNAMVTVDTYEPPEGWEIEL